MGMATQATDVAPLVLLIEPSAARHHHAQLLAEAGFRVELLAPQDVTIGWIEEKKPALIAVELDESSPSDALELTPRLRGSGPVLSRTDDGRGSGLRTPVIVYGHGLAAADIERAARGGALWLQLEPSDGVKLVAAIRGVLTAAGVLRKP
jgi:hypothetical protein